MDGLIFYIQTYGFFSGLRLSIEENITDFCMFMIGKMNRSKNRCLAKRLFDLANLYEPRPKTRKVINDERT